MSWVFGPGSSPGGADQDIQFNNNGEFSGSNLLTTDGTGSLSASVNISASAFYGDGSNLTGVTASAVQVADGPEFSLQFRRDTPVTGEISGSENFSVSSDMTKLFITGTLIASGATAANIEGPVIITSPEGKLEVQDTTNNYQVTLVPAIFPRVAFGTITDEDQYMVIDGGSQNRIITVNDFFIGTSSVYNQGLYYDVSEEKIGINTNAPTHDFTVDGDISASANVSASAFYFGAGGRQIISDTGTDMSILASTTGMFISADGGNLTLQNNVAIDTAGVISSSQNISGSGLYAEDAYVSSIPADRVLVSTTNGQITSHSPFTFSSDVLSVPTITASVGISSSLLIVEPTSGSLAGPGSYLGLNTNNQIIVTSSAGGGGGTPGGSNTEVQFNDGGSFGGDSTFTFNKTSNVLSAPTITASVGIQTEALEVTSSANGSISIGEGISYTYDGVDRLDIFENEFKFQNVKLYQGVSTENTSNFNIGDKQVFLVDSNSSVVTGTLPGVNSSDDYGVTFIIKDSGGNAGTNNVVIEPSGSQKIDGGTAAKIEINYGAITVVAISSSVNGLFNNFWFN